MSQSHFPLKIQYLDDNSIVVVKHPGEVDEGRGFKVLETNWKK